MLVTAVAAFAWPAGVFHRPAMGAAIVGVVGILVMMLQLLFGALLENNRTIGRGAHRAWVASFLLTGPIGLAAYWALHVWPARQVPHAEGRLARVRSSLE